jgi:lipoprotein-releasing system permease protein
LKGGSVNLLKTGPAFFIALRYLLGRAREGGRYLRGAAAGIALSLIPIIVTLIVADGMIRGITDRYLELGTGHLQVYNYLFSNEPENALPFIKDIPGVRGAWSERHGLGVVYHGSSSKGVTIRAVEKSFWEDPGSMKYLKVLSGEARTENDRDVLLGEDLANSIGAAAGSTVRIMTIRSSAAGRNIPRVSAFNVRGIISSGYRELDSLWCIMSLEAGKQILPDSGGAFLMLKIDDPYREADSTAAAIYDVLDSDYGVYTWKSIQRSQYSSYESTRQLLLFIMALIVIVAAVNVSSATSMLVIERQRDIAVLKVTGAGIRGISGIFIWGSFLTGLIGAIIGITLGLLIGININPLIRSLEKLLSFISGLFRGGQVMLLDPGFYLETIPIVIDWTAVILIGCFTILCSCLASWIPARRAGRLIPMELLRKD